MTLSIILTVSPFCQSFIIYDLSPLCFTCIKCKRKISCKLKVNSQIDICITYPDRLMGNYICGHHHLVLHSYYSVIFGCNQLLVTARNDSLLYIKNN